jgi:hypothetical protein
MTFFWTQRLPIFGLNVTDHADSPSVFGRGYSRAAGRIRLQLSAHNDVAL